MKKYLSFCIICLVSNAALSQIELGIKLSPAFSSNRASTNSSMISFDKNSFGLRYTIGITADISLADNYAFSTGLLFAAKRVAIKVTDPMGTLDEKYALQYLQLPATIKLFTNEVAIDTKVYFQLGGVFELKIDEKSKNEANRYIQKFDRLDISLYIGGGLEKKLGTNTSGYAGLFYQRGLINVISSNLPFDGKLEVQSSLMGIDFGFKF